IELSDGSLSKWDELKFTMGVYVGGFLSNPMLFILTLLWVVLRADFSIGLDRTVLVMLFLISFPIMFGTQEFQTRVLYNTPFVIPAAIILFAMGQKGGNPRRTMMILVTASLIMATYALRSMANLYLVAPEYYTLTDQFLLP
ncbi:MAG: hypothetical protein MN733_43135, partial [Nitrososphaera sp.]|nr:hypothetical protein [Nitrososphaera sp.]